MRISVIVPYWNAEKWIGRCVSSLKKAEGDFEFLLIDDRSTDASRKIAMETARHDNRFDFYANTRRKGVSGARNTGLDLATGEWVTFLDADDELLPDAHWTFQKMAHGNINQSNHYRHYVEKGKTVLKYTNREGTYRLQDFPKMWCMVWNKLYRREFIGETRFVEGMQFGEDEIFTLEMLLKENLIWHTSNATIKRNFDNKGSLAHIKGKGELIRQAQELEAFLMRCEDAEMRMSVLTILSEHWGSKTYRKVFG